MAIHLAAAFENVDQSLGNIQWLDTDQGEELFRTESSRDDLVVRRGFNRIVAAWVASNAIEQARFVSQSLREMHQGRFIPLLGVAASETAVEPGSPPVVNDFRGQPVVFDASDRLNLQVANSGATDADDVLAAVWFSDGQTSPATLADSFWIRATTSASAMTADEWNSRDLTLDNSLKGPGDYEVVGAYAHGTSLAMMRFVDPEDTPKPGILCSDTVGEPGYEMWTNGQLGPYVTFEHDEPPTVEFLPAAADNEVQEVLLRVRKV